MSEAKNIGTNLLNFNSMITPKIITFLYYIMLIGVILSAIVLLFQGSIGGGIAAALFGAIGVRVWCELMIVLFKINENIQKIADKA